MSEHWTKITGLLRQSSNGNAAAQSELYERVYSDLHSIAARLFSLERPGHILQPTALVNEAFLRISSGANVEYKDRVHFFAIAARQMRRILVDLARERKAAKRNGPIDPDVTLTLIASPDDTSHRLDMLEVD